MLRMRAELVAKVRAAQVPQDLYEYLQGAIELEHSTIPPYLTALYSLKPGKKNLTVARIIRSIVIEEMLHMTIAANVLNAIGGSPNINKPGFVPTYPGPLPMIVDDFKVGLSKLTRELVEKVFMRIEQPEYHVQLQMRAAAMTAAAAADAKTYATVGEFYNAIIEKLTELDAKGPLFTGKPAWQVVDNTFYTPDELFPIVDLDTATRALNVIKQQGEGTDVDPFEADGQPAHYYRFWEILKGHKLIKDPVTGKPDWKGDAVDFDESEVYDLVANSKAEMYGPDTNARLGVDLANAAYSRLLNALHGTFNGAPSKLDAALAIMDEFRLTVLEKVLTQTASDGQKVAAPSFEYVATV
jgi:hypothetical protein